MILDDIKKSIEMISEGIELDVIVKEIGTDNELVDTIRTKVPPKEKVKKEKTKEDGRKGGNRQKTHETFIKEVEKMYGDEYTVLGTYTKNKVPIKVRHNCPDCNNHEWSPRPMDFICSNPKKRNTCPICRKAKLKAERASKKNG